MLNGTKRKGFTLIELLVVIAIIGLLASIVLVALSSARAKSRDAKRLADIHQLYEALQLYYDTNNTYPLCGVGSFDDDGACSDYSNDGVFLPDLVNGGFIGSYVLDPINNTTYRYRYYGNASWVQGTCGVKATILMIEKFETPQTNHGGATCPAGAWNGELTNGYVIQLNF